MRHRVAHRKLGRVTEHRISLLRNQATAILEHEHIITTVPKAKELRPYVERLISVAKRGVAAGGLQLLNARRMVGQDIANRDVLKKLFDTLAPRFAERPGGYVRILKAGVRKGDAAPVALVELIGSEFDPKKAEAAGKDGKAAAKDGKQGGMAGRLRRVAERVRGRKADADETGAPVHERTKAPTRSTAKPRQTGRTGGNKGS
ncbi:MAG: 50S ribosomal protein L17 [Acidobacteria bacterium]|nr:50S ribosomal protein L17 [Acidobacteriota bacterium]